MKSSALALLPYLLMLLSPAHSFPRRATNFPYVHSGRYTIVNCGENQAHMVTLLNSLWAILQPAIQDAKNTIPSQAFTTFFGDRSRALYVADILSKIASGVAMDEQEGSPVLFCVTAAGQVVGQDRHGGRKHDMYTTCLSQRASVATHMFGSRFSIFCDSFFHSPLMFGDVPPPTGAHT